MGRYAYRGRHRPPDPTGTAVRTAALSAGVVAAVMVGSVAPAAAAPDSDDPWHRLRMCESGGNYKINTGNGYYGAYQFNLSTWRAYGGKGHPHQASPAEQDYRAKLLFRARGWAPWPGCSRKLGLVNRPRYGAIGDVPAPDGRTTMEASARLVRGETMVLRGSARAGATVKVYVKHRGESDFRLLRTLRANGAGRWSTSTRPMGTARYYAESGGTRSATAATRVVYGATVTGPATVVLRTRYTITGTARPHSRVLVRLRHAGASGWKYAYYRRTDRAGRWSMVWRGTYDYQYIVVGETRSTVETTRVATVATASAPPSTRMADGAGRPMLTLAGTARPRSTLVLYVRTPGGSFRVYGKVTTGAGGRWTHDLRPPAGSFRYYVASSNGLRSAVRSVEV